LHADEDIEMPLDLPRSKVGGLVIGNFLARFFATPHMAFTDTRNAW
jgi:hypothetical protein